jgi:UDP-N-acetylglucosamine 2-epimerase (non-hydrolysing)
MLSVGDVTSTMACSVAKMGVKVLMWRAASVFDGMPEEINRMVTDSISDYFYNFRK